MQFQVMETLGNLSPMPDDVGRNKFEKLGKLLYLILTTFPPLRILGLLTESFTKGTTLSSMLDATGAPYVLTDVSFVS